MSEKAHAILLLHGLGGGPAEMTYLKKRLVENGFVVEVPLLPGHGTHYTDLTKVKWEELAEAATHHFFKLKSEYETVSVSGLCLGAVLALYLGITQKEKIQSIAPISTTLFYDGWSLPYLARFMKFFRYTPFYYTYNLPEGDPYGIKDERIRKWIASKMGDDSTTHYSKIPFRSFWQMHLLNEYVRSNLNHIKSPVFAIHPLDDDVASVKSVDFMKANIEENLFQNLILQDSYHLATIDREKELVAGTVIDFFMSPLSKSRVS
jgi:carboxylesterase